MDEDISNEEALGTASILEVGAWEVVNVTGADRLSFLHRLLTASLDDLPVGQGRRALLLTIKGHVVVEFIVCAGAEAVLLLVPPGQGAIATAALSRYAIMDDVTLTALTHQRPVAVYGSAVPAALARAGVTLPDAVSAGVALAHGPCVWESTADLWAINVPAFAASGVWVIGDAATVDALEVRLQAGGVARLGADQTERRRIEAGEARFGAETTEDVFPMEVGLDGLIDYGKGCYLGQEPIVRIRDRGHVNRRLVGLRFAGPAAVAAGDALATDTRPKAGRITSVAGGVGLTPVALGLLHVSVPVGAAVQVHHGEQPVAATAVALPAPRGAS